MNFKLIKKGMTHLEVEFLKYLFPTEFENANIRVVNAEDSPLGDGPWTSHSGLCGMQGDYISMTKEFVEGDDQFVQTFGSKEALEKPKQYIYKNRHLSIKSTYKKVILNH
ncbi:hypothetical protein QYM36_017732, partial [Artemia franciscana]